MWPIALMALLLIGAAANKRKKDESGPLEQEPDEDQAAAEAEAAAQEAIEKASAGVAAGSPSGAQQAADALEQAAGAAQAAAGTSAQDLVNQIAKQVEALAQAAAAKAGVPPPSTSSPAASPGQPPISTPSTEPTVVVEPAPAPGAPMPPPPPPTASPPTTVPGVIKAVEDVVKQLPIPVPVNTTPPLADEETRPELDPQGTIGLARAMLDRETRPNWEDALQPEIKAWQAKVGLTADGKFGPKSALTMGKEVGVLPFVRAWPKGSNKSTVLKKYRNDVNTLAANLESQGHPEHARALEVSAAREDARTFLAGSNPPAVSQAERLAQLEALVRQVA